MSPSLCKQHFRKVANYFDKETALAYAEDDTRCVICAKVVFVEGARRYVAQPGSNGGGEEATRPPDVFAQLGA
jgi:hypothetical protein